jgi:hypothetical protein
VAASRGIGWSSSEPATFRPYATVGPPKSLTSFLIGAPVGDDLGTLVTLLSSAHLTVDIGWQGLVDRSRPGCGRHARAKAARQGRVRDRLSFTAIRHRPGWRTSASDPVED